VPTIATVLQHTNKHIIAKIWPLLSTLATGSKSRK